jgi:hypothetical protein
MFLEDSSICLERLKSDKYRLGRQRHQGDRLFTHLVEDGLLPGQHGAAHGVDDVVVALGVDDAAVVQRVGVGDELVLDLQLKFDRVSCK